MIKYPELSYLDNNLFKFPPFSAGGAFLNLNLILRHAAPNKTGQRKR